MVNSQLLLHKNNHKNSCSSSSNTSKTTSRSARFATHSAAQGMSIYRSDFRRKDI